VAKAKRVLLLDNSIDHSIYDPVKGWAQFLDCGHDALSMPKKEYPRKLLGYSHVIVTGSESSIRQDDDWILRECKLIRELASRKIPILASCFGNQLVVRALSGKRYVRATPTPEFGWQEVLMEPPSGSDDPVFGPLPPEVFMFSSHFDEVYPLPADWVRMAFSLDCANSILKWGKGKVWGIQHHPEISIEEGEQLLVSLMEKMPDRRRMIRSRLQSNKRDSMICRDVVKRFLAVK
jgi:GMP synthase-like glutamine amidotransferase